MQKSFREGRGEKFPLAKGKKMTFDEDDDERSEGKWWVFFKEVGERQTES